MKVLHVGWWITPYRYGGAINAALTLMREQIRDGMDVYYFCGGRYNLFKKKTYIKRWEEEGIKIFELINSPNTIGSYSNPTLHCRHPEIEKHFKNVLRKVNPDVIHIQELESLCASLITEAKQMGYPVVMFLRNYWPLCCQRDLLTSQGIICFDTDNGNKCINCRLINNPPRIGWMILGYTRKTPLWPLVNPLLEVARIGYGFFHRKSNKVDPSLAQNYLLRRNCFIETLNKADLLLPISRRTRDIYEAFAIQKNKMKVTPSLSGAIDIIRPKPFRDSQLPISFGYMGGINFNKGVHILIKAFKRLPQDRARLLLFGKGTDTRYLRSLKREASGLNIAFRGPYSISRINQVLEEIDIGLIPSIWEEAYGLVGQEFLAARIPVIGSDIGGIRDYIINGENGYLTPPNDPDALFHKMMQFIKKPELILQLQKKIRNQMDCKEYSKKITDIYLSLIKQTCSKC